MNRASAISLKGPAELTKIEELSQNESRLLELEAVEEYNSLRKQIPRDWKADIRHGGKFIALFDRSQQEVNRRTAYPEQNRQEIIHIYSMQLNRGSYNML